jgi:hypothetical protein
MSASWLDQLCEADAEFAPLEMPRGNCWLSDEDDRLQAARVWFGEEWDLIAREVRTRTARACRNRWQRELRPLSKKEQARFRVLYAMHGTQWSVYPADWSVTRLQRLYNTFTL